jgi:hypothetical protein
VGLHGTDPTEQAERSRHGLAFGTYHDGDLLVGVAGAYLVTAGGDDALVLEESQE